MYHEDDLLPVSGLQHLLFCPRQCALIHVEQVWVENFFTAAGRATHQRAHDGPSERGADGVRTLRGLRLRSLALGLSGQADVVEIHPVARDDGVAVPGNTGLWRVRPVEYKRGKPKTNHCDEVQLCAQAVCLEEMLHTRIEEGDIFYGRTHRRATVRFDDALRTLTANTAAALHQLIASGETPPPVNDKRCRSCSLAELCMPDRTARPSAAARYIQRHLRDATQPNPEGDSTS